MTRAPTLASYLNRTNAQFRWGRASAFEDSQQSSKVPQVTYKGILYRGIYSEQVARYAKHFELGESLKVVRYELFKADPEAVLNEVFDFIGVKRIRLSKETLEKNYMAPKNSSRTFRNRVAHSESIMSNDTRAYLRAFYKPYNDELANVLGDDWRHVWV